MAIPQDLSDLLQALDTDKTDVSLKSSDLDLKTTAATDAATAATNAAHDLDASKQHLAADLAATIAKLTSTYGT